MKYLQIALLFLVTVTYAQFAGGTGTTLDPYQIETPAQLDSVRNYLSSSFIMNNDIDLTDYLSPSGAGYNGGSYWIPLGTFPDYFSGDFNGNHHTIYGLKILSSDEYVGFFGSIVNATVRNLNFRKVADDWIVSTSTTADTGSIVGNSYISNVINCSSDLDILSSDDVAVGDYSRTGGLIGFMQGQSASMHTLSGSFFTGTITGGNAAGGLAGECHSTGVDQCYSICEIRYNQDSPSDILIIGGLFGTAGRVNVSNSYTNSILYGKMLTGGFIGLSADSDYSDCYSKSTVYCDSIAGGFCGLADGGLVEYCWSAGEIICENTAAGFVNTDIFLNFNFVDQNPGSPWTGFDRLDYSYWDTDSSGQSGSGQGQGRSSVMMRYPEAYGPVPLHRPEPFWEWGNHGWEINPFLNDGYPYLTVFEPEVTTPHSGSGTVSDPYLISTQEQFDLLRYFEGNHYSGNYFRLSGDIELTGDWEPIGNNFDKFQAKIDGDHHKITGFKINRPDESRIGLFGNIIAGSEIRNLFVSTDSMTAVTGKDSVGILVGANFGGIIENCSVRGTVTGSEYAGGIAGYMSGGSLTDSYSIADVSANNYAGGLIGKNQNGTVARCYNAGPVFAMGDAGGLIAWNESMNVTDCYWDIETSGQGTFICGTGLTTAEMKERLNYTNWDFSSRWGIHPLFNDGYPFLKYEDLEPNDPFASGTGTEADPFQITTPDDLELVRLYEGSFSKGKYFRLMNDIDLTDHLAPSGAGYNEGKMWLPIGKPDSVFAGVLQGDSKNIKNLGVNRPDEDYTGLFGYTTADAVLSSIKLVNDDSVTVIGGSFTGALAGSGSGTVEKCFSNIKVTGVDVSGGLIGHISGGIVEQCVTSGGVNGQNGIGGLCGYMSGGLITDSYSTAELTANNGAGGLLGQACYPAVAENCYSAGSVTGTSDTGGLIGDSFYSDITGCYWDTQTSGQVTSAGGTGKLTSEMTEQLTFSGWDFSSPVWNIDQGFNGGYPYLSWQAVIYYPQNLTMEFVGEDQVSLTWDAVSGATGYRIYSSNEPFGTFILTADVQTESWSTTISEDRYFYYVVAYNNEKKYK